MAAAALACVIAVTAGVLALRYRAAASNASATIASAAASARGSAPEPVPHPESAHPGPASGSASSPLAAPPEAASVVAAGASSAHASSVASATPKRAARFDSHAAAAALTAVNGHLSECKKTPNGPRGPGSVRVDFDNDGRVRNVSIGWPYDKTTEGECVREHFRAVRVAPYAGAPAALNHKFELRK
jgi:hypothetical protein